jgi:hypothetical protein
MISVFIVNKVIWVHFVVKRDGPLFATKNTILRTKSSLLPLIFRLSPKKFVYIRKNTYLCQILSKKRMEKKKVSKMISVMVSLRTFSPSPQTNKK